MSITPPLNVASRKTPRDEMIVGYTASYQPRIGDRAGGAAVGDLRSTAISAPILPAEGRDIPSSVLIAAMLLSFLTAQYSHAFSIDPIRAVPAVLALIALCAAMALAGERRGLDSSPAQSPSFR